MRVRDGRVEGGGSLTTGKGRGFSERIASNEDFEDEGLIFAFDAILVVLSGGLGFEEDGCVVVLLTELPLSNTFVPPSSFVAIGGAGDGFVVVDKVAEGGFADIFTPCFACVERLALSATERGMPEGSVDSGLQLVVVVAATGT